MADKMTPGERMGALITGQKPDRVPVSPFILGYAATVNGLPLGDLYADAKKSFKAQLLCMDMHGYDSTPMYGYAAIGGWEFGGTIKFPYDVGESAPAVTKFPVESEEAVDRMEVPEPSKAGSGPIAMELARQCNALGMPAIFQCGEVLTYAANIMGPSRLLSWMIRKPDIVHKALSKIADYQIAHSQWFVSTFGADKCTAFAGGPVESSKLISPKQFEQFVYPYMLRVHRKVLDMGVHVILEHPCADQNKNIPYYKRLREECGWKGKYVWNFGPETPLETQIREFGDHDIIGGNVDPPSFQFKSFDEIVALCKDNIERGMKSPSGYILMPGCEMPPNALPVNVHAMMVSARKFGTYP